MSNRQILFHIGKSATMRILINVERIETIAGDFYTYCIIYGENNKYIVILWHPTKDWDFKIEFFIHNSTSKS